MAEGKFVSYLRVSTEKQGRSGLGLEAQRNAVEQFLNGGRWALLEEFVEVETGKGSKALSKRPKLRAAIEACKKSKAVLVIAKLDRLARNVAFVSKLMEDKVEFVAADMPSANRLTVHILAAVAEEEARAISARTKAALAAAKARGVKLGSHGRALAQHNRSEAGKHAQAIKKVMAELAGKGLSLRSMADELNIRKIPTARGGRWHLRTVQRVLHRIDGSR
jgi:DNA invertase Pin-like site-specific DNA recombinase